MPGNQPGQVLRRIIRPVEEDDKVTLTTLDLFRKDISTYMRLYDFMSQIVDYRDPYLEILSIFLRLLEKVIAESAWAAEVASSRALRGRETFERTDPISDQLWFRSDRRAAHGVLGRPLCNHYDRR